MRMGSRSRSGCCVVALATVSLIAACGSSSSGSTKAGGGGDGKGIPNGPIKVGIIGALSGPTAAYGNLQVTQQKALVDWVNSTGGIAGHKVQLVVKNSEGNPALEVSAAKALVNEGVVATMYNGQTQDGKEQAVAIEQKAHIIGISPESLVEYDNAKTHPYYFSDNPGDPVVTAGVATFAKQRNFDQIGQLGDSTPFAKSLETNFSKAAQDKGLKVVKTVDYPTTATSMTTQLSQLKQAGAKTLGLWCEVGCGQVFDGLRQIGWKPNVIGNGTLYYVGYKSVKDYGDVTYADCPASVASKDAQPSGNLAKVLNFVVPKTGGPSILSQGIPINADGWMILKYGIEKAKSVDGTKIRDAIETINEQSFTNPDIAYTFNSEHHAGAHGANGKPVPMCGFSALGPMDLPVKAS